MNKLTDSAIFACSVHYKLVQGDLSAIFFASVFSALSFVLFSILRLHYIARLTKEWIIICVLAAKELIGVLLVTPDDLITIIVWLQSPKNNLIVVFADSDQTGVVLQPLNLSDSATVPFEHAIGDP